MSAKRHVKYAIRTNSTRFCSDGQLCHIFMAIWQNRSKMKSSLEDVMREFQINGNDAGQRVDKFLTKAVPLLPQSMLYKAIRTKRIKLNGKRC